MEVGIKGSFAPLATEISGFNWDNCPEEVLFKIFTFFDIRESYPLSLVCKRFHQLAFDDVRMKAICHECFPFTCTKKGIKDYAESNGWVKTLKLLSGLRIPFHSFGPSTSSAIDGDIYVAGNVAKNEGSIKVWDLCTGESLYAHNVPYKNLKENHVAIEGSQVVFSCSYHDIKQNVFYGKLFSCDVKSDVKPKLLSNKQNRFILSIAIKNGIVVTGDCTGWVELWRIETGKSLHTFKAHEFGGVNSLTLEDDFFASAGDDGLIKIWDFQTFKCTTTLKGHEGPINSISGNQKYLASGGRDKILRIWDLALESCLHTFPPQEDEIQAVVLENNLVLCTDLHTVVGKKSLRAPMEIYTSSGQLIREVSLCERDAWINTLLWNINTQECLGKYSVKGSIAMQGEVFVIQRDTNPASTLFALKLDSQHKKTAAAKSTCTLQ